MLLLSLSACNTLWQPAPGGFPGGGDGKLGLPPVLTLVSPEEGAQLVHHEGLTLVGSVEDPDTSVDRLTLTLSSDISGALDLELEMTSGGNFVGVVDLPVGAHVLTLTVTDEFEHSDSAQVSVEKLANRPPTDPVVLISPDDPVAGEEIRVAFVTESSDPDGDDFGYAYRWYKDGVEQTEWAGKPNITDGVININEIWGVEVFASDTELESGISSDEVLVTTAGPIITIALEPFGASANDDIICDYTVVDYEGNPITEEEATWLINGAEAGDAAQPLTSGFVRGDQVTCRVRAVSSVEKTRQETINVENAVPQISNVTISPAGDGTEATTYSCSGQPSDADGDPISLTTTWYVNGSAALVGNGLDGTWFDKGDEVYCTLRADDGQGGIGSGNSSTVTIVNTPPTAAVLDLDPYPAFPGDTVTCNQTTAPSDPDPADSLTITTAWTVNGSSVGSGSTYDTTGRVEGDLLECTVSASDGTVSVDASASVTLAERLSGSVFAYQADIQIKGSKTDTFLGNTVVNAGDVDADGTDDLLIGASNRSNKSGAVFLFSGAGLGSNNLDTSADYWWSGSSSSLLGGGVQGVSYLGDTDGDGADDLLMAAPYATTSVNEGGAVYLFETGDMAGWGQGNAPGTEATATIKGDGTKDRLGAGIGSVDVDGDGTPDLLVGIPYDDGAATNAGAVAVYLGGGLSGNLLPSDADYTMTGDQTADRLGNNAVRAIGDVDGDGTEDLFIGAHNMSATSSSNTGVGFIVSGSSVASGSTSSVAALRIEGVNTSDSFGDSATTLGDLDGDGSDDFAVGARFGDEHSTDAGSVYFWFGSTTTGTVSANTADATWGSSGSADRLGWEMSSGDLDGDGSYELLVGSYGSSYNSKSSSGEGFVLLGSGYGSWTTGADIDDDDQVKFQGNQTNQYAGRSGAVISDLNSDGYSEWVVSSQGGAAGNIARAGFVYVFYGP